MAANYQPPQWLIPENNNTNKVGNYSLNLDSVGDVISLGDASLIGNKATLSVSVWFNTKDGTNVQGIIGAYAGGTGSLQKWFSIQIDLNDSYTIRVIVANATGNNPYVDFNPVLATDTWYHLVMLYDGGGATNTDKVKVYLNAGLLTSNNDFGTLPTTTYPYTSSDFPLWIGSRGYNTNPPTVQLFDGEISELSIFDYILSSGNITTLYGDSTNGVGNPMALSSPPIGYWKGDKAGFGDQWAVPNLANNTSDSNYSFDFDGVGDYIDCGTISALNGGITAFSVSCWINPSATTSNVIISGGDSTSDDFYIQIYNSTTIRYGSGSQYDDLTISALSTGTWYHLVTVHNGTNLELYIDGTSVGTATVLAPTNDIGTDLIIGDYQISGSGYEYAGKMNEVAVWDSALSAANITTLYNSGRPGDLSSFSPTPVSWWKLGNDAFATKASSTAWTIPDQIGSNDGTSAGSPDISGEAPGSSNNGLSLNMNINDRTGESGHSVNNAQSYNMATTTRIAYT